MIADPNLLLIPYTAAAYALHGGQIATGVPRWVRNAACALPFAYVGFMVQGWELSMVMAALAFVGSTLPHEDFWLMGTGVSEPRDNWITKIVRGLGFTFGTIKYDVVGMAIKGFVNFPPTGWLMLPASYYLGDRTKFNTSTSEWYSGILYGVALQGIMLSR